MKIIDMIFPPVCGICGKLSSNSLCNRCKIKYKKQTELKIDDYTKNSSYFDEHFYLVHYEGKIREMILNYKFNEKAYINETFLTFLKNSKKSLVEIKKYDIIIPVPISKKRMKQRGYNQSSIFARKIASMYKLKYDDKIIIKVKNNKTQSELNKLERLENVKNVYQINNTEKIKNKSVLIVDDIFTTGSTVNEISRILKENFANKIGVFTMAKD